MKTIAIYPGTFCPPTYGHLEIVNQAAEIFPELLIICSVNPNKESPWFSPEMVKQLWRAYRLPSNVRVLTLTEFVNQKNERKEIVMVRGLRAWSDLADEQSVMALNLKNRGINKYFYVVTDKAYGNISSTAVRRAAENLDLATMAQMVAPLVVSKLLEKVLQVKNVFLVVGRPGGGKSTFLKKLVEIDSESSAIFTDEFNQLLRPLLIEKFGQADLIEIAKEKPDDLTCVIKDKWLELLASCLNKCRGQKNIFVEIAYALCSDKRLYRHIGGKIIYIGVDSLELLRQRNCERQTPQLACFIEEIPDLEKTKQICFEEILEMFESIETSGTLIDLKETVECLLKKIN